MKFKKILLAMTTLALMASTFAACGKATNDSITVISREDGSGTRGAFIELVGVEEKNAEGKKVDNTTKEAIIANGTDLVLTQVKENESAIGYISLGSLNADVKALKVDGVQASAENIKNGSYKVARPFNIATKGEISEVAQDFIDFILSAEGQKIVSDKYIAVDDSAPAYSGTKPSGKVVASGSTSVGPVMEKLAEAYQKVNTNATVEVQQTDSTSGMKAAMDGTCDIGMASRELKDSEKAELTPTVIAMDGIAVIVNKKNSISDITSENIKNIYTGKITKWSEIK